VEQTMLAGDDEDSGRGSESAFQTTNPSFNGPKTGDDLELSALTTNDAPPPKAKRAQHRGSTIFTTKKPVQHIRKGMSESMPVVADPYHMALLVVLLSLPTFLFVLGFSAMGFGLPTYRFLRNNSDFGSAGMGLAFFIGCCLYLLDAEYWSGEYDRHFWTRAAVFQRWKPLNKLRKIACGTIGVLFVQGLLFRVNQYQYGPLCLFLMLMLGYITAIKRFVFGKEFAVRQYVGTLPAPLLLVSAWVFVWWVLWTNHGDPKPINGIWSPTVESEYASWSVETKIHYAERIGCEESDDVVDNGDGGSDLKDPYPLCLSAFLLWGTPCAVAFSLAAIAMVCYVLDPKDSHGAPKMLGQFLLLLLFGLWVTASISGAGSVITEALGAFILAGMCCVCGFVVYTHGLEMFKHPDEQPFMKKMTEKYGSWFDVMRGLLIVTCLPLIGAFFTLSFVNQAIRKCPCIPITKKLDETDRHLTFTKLGSSLWCAMLTWKWTQVLTYALYWGIFFFTTNVVISRFTVLFLSWLILVIAPLNFGLVSVVFFVVGFLMFMAPPVPGVPVYLSSGIILIAAGEKSLGIAGSIVYAFVFCMVLKLMAVVGQMYCFGVPLGNRVSVRLAVGVNSDLVRAMKLVLSKPFSIAKVTILVGGPDWPTSVLCGILRLNLFSCLLGTLPVAFLILPTILAGSFFYLADRDAQYATFATIFAASAALVQSGSMLVAAYYLDKAAIEFKDELAAMPYDQEVLEAETKAKILSDKYSRATQWEVLPFMAKQLLKLACLLMVVACYSVQLLECFVPYELTSRPRDLPNGQWYNMVIYPTGVLACFFFLSSCVVFYAFKKWAASRAKAWPDEANGQGHGQEHGEQGATQSALRPPAEVNGEAASGDESTGAAGATKMMTYSEA